MFETYENKTIAQGRCCKCGKPLPFACGDNYICLECESK